MIDFLVIAGLVVGLIYFIYVRRQEKREEKFEKRKW
jgi:preprotein translocase subunit YajC